MNKNLQEKILWKLLRIFYFKHKYPIIVNSIPKCGTHLLTNIVLNIPNTVFKGELVDALSIQHDDDRLKYIKEKAKDLSPGSVYLGHVSYSENYDIWLKENNIKQLLIIRDPRDFTVSLYHYIMKNPVLKHRNYDVMHKLGTDHKRLMGAITGIGQGKDLFVLTAESLPNVKLFYDYYKQWLTNESTLILKYEDFVRNDKYASESMRKILNFLGLKSSMEQLIAKRIKQKGMDPKKSATFRKGEIGNWKDEYKKEHIVAFKRIFNDNELTELGYEW